MIIMIDETGVLNVKEFITMILSENKKKVSKRVPGGLFGMDKAVETEEKDGYALKIDYVNIKDERMMFTCKHPDYEVLRKKGKRFIEQLKQHDSSFVTAAFEDAFLKE